MSVSRQSSWRSRIPRLCAIAAGVIGLGSMSQAGCVDLEPTTDIQEELPEGDAGGLSGECTACIQGESGNSLDCRDEFEACDANSACKIIAQCSLDRGCFNVPAAQQINCGIPCGYEAGITSLTDPSIALVSEWTNCVVPPCAEVCGFNGEVPGG